VAAVVILLIVLGAILANPTQANRLLDWVVERADERIGTVRLGAVKKW
jgi:hypothetical protein